MADDILKNIPLPADLPENWTSGQIIAPTGAEAGLDEQHGYNYLMEQVNNAQKALKALAAQREEDLARIKFWISNDPTSPASFIGGTWEQIAADRALMGASSTHPAGTTAEAGLPNITGELISRASGSSSVGGSITAGYGAFKISVSSAGGSDVPVAFQGGLISPDRINLDASYVSPIYGASATVQPPAYYSYVWKRIE